MFKLIAIDLDGTLLNKDKKITMENLELINKIISLGYEVVIATGRRYYSAKELTKGIDRHLTILANNGNIVRKSEDDKVLFASYMGNDDFKEVITGGWSRNLHPIIHVDYFNEGYDMIIEEDLSHEGYSNYLPKDEKRFRIISKDLIFNLDRVLAVVYPGSKLILNEFYNEINNKYPNRYSSHVIENIDIAEAMFEIMNPLGSKWKSLIEYSNSLGIRAEEIIAIGDDNNDAEMILNAGIGIAMKNASSLVKEVADIISSKDNNESGVAFELKRVLRI